MKKTPQRIERDEIHAMYAAGYSVKEIANKFNKDHSTICRRLGKMENRPKIRLNYKEEAISLANLILDLESLKSSIEKILDKIKRI